MCQHFSLTGHHQSHTLFTISSEKIILNEKCHFTFQYYCLSIFFLADITLVCLKISKINIFCYKLFYNSKFHAGEAGTNS